MPDKPQLPTIQTTHTTTRHDRSTSLSFARSPNNVITTVSDPFDAERHPHHGHHLSPNSSKTVYTKTDKSLPAIPSSTSHTLAPRISLTVREEDEELESGGIVLKDLGPNDLPKIRRGSFGSDSDSDSDDTITNEAFFAASNVRFGHGPDGEVMAFQKPDSKELFWMLLSFGGVVVIALAAGLTTIYDWVL